AVGLIRQGQRGRGEDVLSQILRPVRILHTAPEVAIDVAVVATESAFDNSVHAHLLAGSAEKVTALSRKPLARPPRTPGHGRTRRARQRGDRSLSVAREGSSSALRPRTPGRARRHSGERG